MADDGENSGSTTDPLPAISVDHDLDGGPHTIPMPMAQADDEVPTNPRQAIEGALPLQDEVTSKVDLSDGELAKPDDETGYIDARGLGSAPEGATNKLPVPAETMMTEIKDARPRADGDTTNVAGVSDDAIVRRVVLPDFDEPPTAERPRPNPTRAAQLMAPRPSPPEQQLPPTQQSQLVTPEQLQSRPVPPAKPIPTSGLIKQFRASSGFWRSRPPTGASSSSDGIDTADFAERQKRAYVVALVTCALLLFALAVLTIISWSPPGDVIVLGLLSVIPTTLIVGWVTRPVDRDLVPEDAKIVLGPVAAALFAMLVLPLPWQVGYARLALRSLAGQSPDMTARVMRDRSDAVVAAECKRVIATFPRVGVAELLAATLPGRPDVAEACIAADPTIAPLVSARLVEIWGAALVDKSTPAQSACRVAEAMTALQRPAGEVETRLLSCVMAAPADVRVCCGDALAAANNDWVAKVESEPAYVPDERTAANLLALSFGSSDVSEAQKEVVARAGFVGAPAQRMAIVFACASTKAGANLGDEFVESLGQCSVDTRAFARDREAWLDICARAEDRLVRRRQDPRESLCQAAGDYAARVPANDDDSAE